MVNAGSISGYSPSGSQAIQQLVLLTRYGDVVVKHTMSAQNLNMAHRPQEPRKRGFWAWLHVRLQIIGFLYLGVALIAAVFVAFMAAFGLMPWLEVPLEIGGQAYANAGMVLQLAGTGVLFAMMFFLPGALRVLHLENSHRSFHMTMEDVTRAYLTAHEADRAGVFSMSSEFDAVRERMIFMREHPDLIALEPALIDVAAQMSQTSRDLAAIYSDEKMARARSVLRQRQEELIDFQDHLEMAKKTTAEIRRWVNQLEIEESITDSQVAQLKTDLAEVLPGLGLKVIKSAKPARAMAQPEGQSSTIGRIGPQQPEGAKSPETADPVDADRAKVVAMTARARDKSGSPQQNGPDDRSQEASSAAKSLSKGHGKDNAAAE